ncbi:MAG: GNAT family N-acetyltransferase [Erysipelotrichaceae bacterium]|nr:GNAT family N-acetyltransferase [Erysipelotrichaceae bacterium]MDD3810566.1 GNAT family N-acetyltransferase [Erysipelotrichaceae bacterium]
MEKQVSYRRAVVEDCALILEFIRSLASYENMADQVCANEEALAHWLFEEKKAEVMFVVEDSKEVGFALYFFNFSTFLARPGIHLEDLFVLEGYRHRGYGKGLIKQLIKLARENGCGRIEWSCLDWNEPSIDFYLSLNAKRLDEWLVFRLEEADFDALV